MSSAFLVPEGFKYSFLSSLSSSKQIDFYMSRVVRRGSATIPIPKMSTPIMSIPKMSIPIMSTVPKYLFPLCLLCQNVYYFGKN